MKRGTRTDTLESFCKEEIHCSYGILNDTYASLRISKKMMLEEHSPRRRLSPFIYRSILLTSRVHPPSYYLSVHTYAYIFSVRGFFFDGGKCSHENVSVSSVLPRRLFIFLPSCKSTIRDLITYSLLVVDNLSYDES